VVLEYEAANVGEFEANMKEYATNEAFRAKMKGYTDLLEQRAAAKFCKSPEPPLKPIQFTKLGGVCRPVLFFFRRRGRRRALADDFPGRCLRPLAPVVVNLLAEVGDKSFPQASAPCRPDRTWHPYSPTRCRTGR